MHEPRVAGTAPIAGQFLPVPDAVPLRAETAHQKFAQARRPVPTDRLSHGSIDPPLAASCHFRECRWPLSASCSSTKGRVPVTTPRARAPANTDHCEHPGCEDPSDAGIAGFHLFGRHGKPRASEERSGSGSRDLRAKPNIEVGQLEAPSAVTSTLAG